MLISVNRLLLLNYFLLSSTFFCFLVFFGFLFSAKFLMHQATRERIFGEKEALFVTWRDVCAEWRGPIWFISRKFPTFNAPKASLWLSRVVCFILGTLTFALLLPFGLNFEQPFSTDFGHPNSHRVIFFFKCPTFTLQPNQTIIFLLKTLFC